MPRQRLAVDLDPAKGEAPSRQAAPVARPMPLLDPGDHLRSAVDPVLAEPTATAEPYPRAIRGFDDIPLAIAALDPDHARRALLMVRRGLRRPPSSRR